MERLVVEYNNSDWNVETIFFGKNGDDVNPRIRIGRTNKDGSYVWDLVFFNQVKVIARLMIS